MNVHLGHILEATGGTWVNRPEAGPGPEAICVEAPAELERAGRLHVAFFFSKEYQQQLMRSHAGVLLTGAAFVEPLRASGLPLWKKSAVVACADPYVGMARVSELFASALTFDSHLPGARKGSGSRIHAAAVVDSSARVGSDVEFGPGVVVEAGARIGDRVVLAAGVVVGRDASVGEDSVLFPRVTVYERCVIGRRARIHAGAVIGADGFGFAPVIREGKPERHQKIYHLGRVVIGDDVEIGANSCVDRGTLGDTILADQVKLDNMVQIGHNARLDVGAVVCGSAALAGSSSLGKFVYVGGLTGISNRVHVSDGAKVGAVSLVSKDVPPGGTVLGNPQRDYSDHFRAHAALNKLAVRKRSARP
ncbi:MAG: UDP-3-O-(3-hydroxymyristoyl)glucosamine N-acyltransferase [Bdellovibrionales bacterium]|nr:UDP-3-O-(3-hydroxymyristoyl)glucosamine N-acyltransferase [Bdellovibrionales bacterium]